MVSREPTLEDAYVELVQRGMIRVFVTGVRLQLLQLMRSGFDISAMLVWPIVFASIAFYLLDAKESPRLLFAASLGTAVMMMWAQVVVGAGGALDNQRVFGTLELLVAAPVPLVTTIAPIMIASGAFGVYGLVVTIVWGRLLFGIPVTIDDPLAFAVADAGVRDRDRAPRADHRGDVRPLPVGVRARDRDAVPGLDRDRPARPALACCRRGSARSRGSSAPTWGFRAIREAALGGVALVVDRDVRRRQRRLSGDRRSSASPTSSGSRAAAPACASHERPPRLLRRAA